MMKDKMQICDICWKMLLWAKTNKQTRMGRGECLCLTESGIHRCYTSTCMKINVFLSHLCLVFDSPTPPLNPGWWYFLFFIFFPKMPPSSFLITDSISTSPGVWTWRCADGYQAHPQRACSSILTHPV